MYIHGDFLWNASDAIGGYKETRFWDLVPYLHAGFFRSYGLNNTDFDDNEFAMGGGLLHLLRLSDRLDMIIDMRATVVNGRVIGNEKVAVLPSEISFLISSIINALSFTIVVIVDKITYKITIFDKLWENCVNTMSQGIFLKYICQMIQIQADISPHMLLLPQQGRMVRYFLSDWNMLKIYVL
jgi:hypothetical protein